MEKAYLQTCFNTFKHPNGSFWPASVIQILLESVVKIYEYSISSVLMAQTYTPWMGGSIAEWYFPNCSICDTGDT